MRESAYNLYNSETGNEQRIKISQPGKKNAMYRYTWIVKNIVTGQIDVVENKTEYCKLNNYSLSRMKRIAKNGGIYKHLQIEREEI